MARLAESSVVIAFRDWQWINRRAKAAKPDIMISLEGNPETYLGDLEVAFDEKFFLFEVKSTSSTIKEEWNKTVDKKPKPKTLFKTICQTLNEYGKAINDKDSKTQEKNWHRLSQSMRGHHFLYWDPTISHFAIKPYIFAIYKEHKLNIKDLSKLGIDAPHMNTATLFITSHCLGASQSPVWQEGGDIKYEQISSITPEMLLDKSARLISGLISKTRYWNHLGLSLEELQDYVGFICKNRSYETRCLLTSGSGHIFVETLNTSDLKKIVSAIHHKQVEPNSTPQFNKNSLYETAKKSPS